MPTLFKLTVSNHLLKKLREARLNNDQEYIDKIKEWFKQTQKGFIEDAMFTTDEFIDKGKDYSSDFVDSEHVE